MMLTLQITNDKIKTKEVKTWNMTKIWNTLVKHKH